MFVVIRIYRGTSNAAEVDRRIVASLVPVMRQMPGFRSYTAVDFGGGAICSVSLFDGRAEAEAATTEARGIVQATLTDLVPNPPEMRMGVVMSSTRTGGAASHIAIRTYDGCPDAQELDRRIATHLMPALRAMAGFRSYATADLGAGRVASISLFDSQANAESATAQVRGLVAEHLKDMVPNPPEVLVGRVMSENPA